MHTQSFNLGDLVAVYHCYGNDAEQIFKDSGLNAGHKPWGKTKGRIKTLKKGITRVRIGPVHGNWDYALCIDFSHQLKLEI